MKRIVFYSWQRDLPNATNRGFIESALQIAANSIHNDDSIEVEPVIDRDVSGTGGSPDIATTIFQKIDSADVIVCDVSCIGTAGKRPVPNPNVLVELGYAIRAKGWDRVIMVSNSSFGAVESLPFDLRTRFVIQYQAAADDTDRASPKKQLASRLEERLRSIFEQIEAPKPEMDISSLVELQIEQKQTASLRTNVIRSAKNVIAKLKDDRFDMNEKGDREALLKRIEDYENTCFELAKVVAHGCFYDSNPALWIEVIDLVADTYSDQRYWGGINRWLDLKLYPSLILIHAGGTAAVAAEKYDFLRSLLAKTKFHEYGTNERSLSNEVFSLKAQQTDQFNYAASTNRHTPVSDRIEVILRPALDDLVPQQQRYEHATDKFEYLCGLYSFDQVRWGPMGTFCWRRNHDKTIKNDLEREVRHLGNASPLVTAQLVKGDGNAFRAKLDEFETFVNQCRVEKHIH